MTNRTPYERPGEFEFWHAPAEADISLRGVIKRFWGKRRLGTIDSLDHRLPNGTYEGSNSTIVVNRYRTESNTIVPGAYETHILRTNPTDHGISGMYVVVYRDEQAFLTDLTLDPGEGYPMVGVQAAEFRHAPDEEVVVTRYYSSFGRTSPAYTAGVLNQVDQLPLSELVGALYEIDEQAREVSQTK